MNVVFNFNFPPIWGRASVVVACFGISRAKVFALAKAGHVRARKEDPDCRSSHLVFRLSDVDEWLDKVASAPRSKPYEYRRRVEGQVSA